MVFTRQTNNIQKYLYATQPYMVSDVTLKQRNEIGESGGVKYDSKSVGLSS